MSKDKHATHYDAGGIEALEVIKAKLTEEQYLGFLLGNALKYIQRCNFKGNRAADIRKAANYTKWAAEILTGAELANEQS